MSATKAKAWKVILDKAGTAAENMDIDLGLYKNCSGPVLRVFGWSGPSVTAGYFTDIEKELDTERALSLGIGIAKRPTGGGIAFHMPGDISYSVTAPAALMGSGLTEAYLNISRRIAAALNKLGINAEISSFVRGRGRSGICFSEALDHEITVGGKKLVGSAIKKGRNAVIQQGTITVHRPKELLSLIKGPFDQDEYFRNSAALDELAIPSRTVQELPSLICGEMIESQL